MSKKQRQHVIVIALYALLALLALYMPISHIDTHLPGITTNTSDFYHFHWNYWWIRHALTTPGLNIYETNFVMAPFTSSLAYHTLAAFWYPLWALFEPAFGTIVAMTVIFFTAFVLTGYSFYLLLRREGISPGLTLVGGAILQLSPIMINSVRWTMVSMIGWFWLPLLLLLWGQIARPGLRLVSGVVWAIIFGVNFWAMIMTDIQYPLFAAFLVIPYGIFTLWRSSQRMRLIALGVFSLLLAVALLWFIGPLPYILAFDRSVLSPTPVENAVGVPFPWGYLWHIDQGVPVGTIVLPLTLLTLLLDRIMHWLIGRELSPTRPASLIISPPLPARGRGGRGVRGAAKIGAVVPSVVLPPRWFWLALVPIPLILSVGPFITIAGTQIPMPYAWLHALFGGMFRYPERFAPVFVIPAVTFSLLTLDSLLKRRSSARIVVPAALLFWVIADSRILQPLTLQPIPTPYNFYEQMAHEPYDYVIVEVPTGASSGEGIVGEAVYATTEFYGITHGKRMVNGHISRVDISHYWYLRTDDPALGWLGQRRLLEPELVEPRLREIIYSYPVGYFVIHTDTIERFTGTSTVQEIIGYFNSLDDLLCPVFVEGAAVVYRTTWHPDECPARTPPEIEPDAYQIDIGAADDVRYVGTGWYWPEIVGGLTVRWTGSQPAAELYVDLPAGAYQISISAQSFYRTHDLEVFVNGVSVGRALISSAGLSESSFDIPVAVIRNGKHIQVTLAYDGTDSPQEAGISDSPRELALVLDWIRFRQIQ